MIDTDQFNGVEKMGHEIIKGRAVFREFLIQARAGLAERILICLAAAGEIWISGSELGQSCPTFWRLRQRLQIATKGIHLDHPALGGQGLEAVIV